MVGWLCAVDVLTGCVSFLVASDTDVWETASEGGGGGCSTQMSVVGEGGCCSAAPSARSPPASSTDCSFSECVESSDSALVVITENCASREGAITTIESSGGEWTIVSFRSCLRDRSVGISLFLHPK